MFPRLLTLGFLLPALALSACYRDHRASGPTLRSEADALFDSVEAEGTLAGAFVLDAQSGAAVYTRRDHVRSLPASTMKLVTTAAALSALGPGFRFVTPVTVDGLRLNDALLGDLVVDASGDPSFGSWRFAETTDVCERVADALIARGIRRWSGALHLRNAGALPGAFGPGWAWDDAAYGFSAAPTAFAFRENVVELLVERRVGQRCDAPPLVRFAPSFASPMAIVDVDTSAERHGFGCVRERSGGFRCLWRSPADACPRQASMRVAIDEPHALFTACVHEALAARGSLAPLPVAPVPVAPQVGALVEIASPPLAELVKATNKESINLYAERLGLRFARERTGAESYAALRDAMAQELGRRGISTRLLRPADGSGLSRYNLASARGLAMMLYTSLKEPYADALVESLPIAGVDGTLAGCGASQVHGLVRAKTGSLTGQKAYVGIAERPHDSEHPRVVFALMLGNTDDQPALSETQIFERFAEALVALPVN